MRLVIISHTEHYLDRHGNAVGWGPTIRELNFLATKFKEIYHCAPLHKSEAPPSSLKYSANNIHFVPLIPAGGDRLMSKIAVIRYAVKNIKIISKTLKKVDVFQFRAPTGMGVYLIPYLNLFVKKKGWYKYAGNWGQEHPPLGYAIQRFLLKSQSKRKVTINGVWSNQPAQCISFENPCLSLDELKNGANILRDKKYHEKLNFCFVGRLETAKGVQRIIDAFIKLGANKRIGKIHLIGDGYERAKFEQLSKDTPQEFVFHGYLQRKDVGHLMQKCQVFLLPSTASEGFPKVIAEAANYGCVIVVSDVSSISHFITDGVNGYLCNHKDQSSESFYLALIKMLNEDSLSLVAEKAYEIAPRFTFDHYYNRIEKEILKV